LSLDRPVTAEKIQFAARRARAFVLSPYALILAAYVALRAIAAVGVPAMRHLDTASWLQLDFSGAEIRLWTVPLFFKILPNDPLREAGQVALSIVGWVALAGMTAWSLVNSKLKIVAFAIVLIVSLMPQVTSWDVTILGESVAISVTVGAIAAWWWFAMRPTKVTATVVCAVVVLWAFLRHTNVVVTIPIAGILGASLLIPRARALRAVILVVVAVTLVWGVPTFGKNSYNEDEVLLTVLSERILPSPERTDWFADHGMPSTEDVRSLAGAFEGQGSAPFRANKRFFRWVVNHGRTTYFEFLRTHPGYVLGLPITDAIGSSAVLSGTHDVYGFPRSVLPTPLEDALFGEPWALIVLTAGVGALAILAFGVRGWTLRELVPGIALVLSVVLYWVTFHGVASEPARHYTLAAVGMRISLILIGLLAADRLLSGAATSRGTDVTTVSRSPSASGTP
jgi:hypothetical protein